MSRSSAPAPPSSRAPRSSSSASRTDRGGAAMPIRRGDEYLDSLRDGRCLWLMGQRVEDVTTHPALAGCARSVAAVYDLQHDREHHELLTMPSPTTGQPVSRAYLLPRSIGDLAGQRRMYEFL